jgi:hypothetical protein
MARALLVSESMMKHFVSSALVLATIGALAVADPPKAPPNTPALSMTLQPLQIKLTVKSGSDTRTHELAIFDQGCNRVEEKGAAYEDDINVCTRPGPQGIFVEVSWRTRNGTSEYRTNSGTVIARKGGTFEVGRVNGTRFTLQMQ